jgi:hypothetical protein
MQPPTIVLFCNEPSAISKQYQRYLLGIFRDQLSFGEVPIKLYLRQRTAGDTTNAVEDSETADDEAQIVGCSASTTHIASHCWTLLPPSPDASCRVFGRGSRPRRNARPMRVCSHAPIIRGGQFIAAPQVAATPVDCVASKSYVAKK